MSIAPALPTPARRATLQRRIRLVVGATIAYNAIEAIVALAAGQAASSSALIGFGLDSVAEVLSAAAVAWQFSGRDPQRREGVALRIIALSFFGLAVVVSADALRSLLGFSTAEHSGAGLALTALSVLLMPAFSLYERRTGRELGSASAVADSRQTLLCSYLAAAVLVGLVLNSLLGWAWADAVAALVIAGFAVREGLEAWRGEACAQPVSALTRPGSEDHCC